MVVDYQYPKGGVLRRNPPLLCGQFCPIDLAAWHRIWQLERGNRPLTRDRLHIEGPTESHHALTNTKQAEPIGAILFQSRNIEAASMIRYRDRQGCLLYTSPSPRDRQKTRMPS